MRKSFCAVLVASAFLICSAPGAHATAASESKLSLDFPDKIGLSVRAGTTWELKGVMLDPEGDVRCKNSGYGKVSVNSIALEPTPNAETTGADGAFYETFKIQNTPGTKEVKATCNKTSAPWTFAGNIHVVAVALAEIPLTGVPVLPMAGAGIGMIGIGWVLVYSARDRRIRRKARGHPNGRPGQVRR
jgi:hypothetical protein